jgi:hypothetical protein
LIIHYIRQGAEDLLMTHMLFKNPDMRDLHAILPLFNSIPVGGVELTCNSHNRARKQSQPSRRTFVLLSPIWS